ncbi:hypothetical protein MMMB2_3060 [Mycobacterium marinum MB2]|nr:hypothetical protein MMMB2_3060 [Mycobacterium marinum MB2]
MMRRHNRLSPRPATALWLCCPTPPTPSTMISPTPDPASPTTI